MGNATTWRNISFVWCGVNATTKIRRSQFSYMFPELTITNI